MLHKNVSPELRRAIESVEAGQPIEGTTLSFDQCRLLTQYLDDLRLAVDAWHEWNAAAYPAERDSLRLHLETRRLRAVALSIEIESGKRAPFAPTLEVRA